MIAGLLPGIVVISTGLIAANGKQGVMIVLTLKAILKAGAGIIQNAILQGKESFSLG